MGATGESLRLRTSNKSAVVIGATGLVGAELLRLLNADSAYEHVYAFSRNRKRIAGLTKVSWLEMPDFSEIPYPWPSPQAEAEMQVALASVLPKGEDCFSCLGTTLRDAGSLEKFRFVDYGVNLAFARAAVAKGYTQLGIVSAYGANPKSVVPYSSVKGELELALTVLPFWAVRVYRPGLITGERPRVRVGEKVAKTVLGVLSRVGLFRESKSQAIAGLDIAKAIVHDAQSTVTGTTISYNSDISESAVRYDPQLAGDG